MKRRTLTAIGAIGVVLLIGLLQLDSINAQDASSPVPLGQYFGPPDSPWELKTLSVDWDAWPEIEAENQFNDPPDAGHTFVLIEISIRNRGTEPDNFQSYGISAVGARAVEYRTFTDSCGVIPGDFEDITRIFSGGELQGNICYEVASSDISSLVLFGDRDTFDISERDVDTLWYWSLRAQSSTPTPEPTHTHTPVPTVESTPEPTPVPPSVPDEVYDRLSALEALMTTLQGLITALESRIAALEGDTPEPVSTPTTTPTPQPTSTPLPTATPLPPGVTPEPTATMAPTATATPVPNPCQLDFPSGQLPITVEGSWIDECVLGVTLDDVAAGDRYFRDVIFSIVSVQSSWIATLTSDDADTYLILWEWDDNAESWTRLATNDDIVSGSTNSRIEWTPVEGRNYGLTLTTYTATTLGDFTLTVESGAASGQNSLGLSKQEFSTDAGDSIGR